MSQKIAPRAQHGLLQSETLMQLLGGDAVQILKCGICLEFFDLPIVLPCGHTFCLHCLTEMCRHAIRNSSQTSLQNVRIGCPNCRVLIYASPVLERNVTCNFIIQSLIELLRAREDRKMQNMAVNTDEVRIGPKIRTPSDNDVARLMQDLDRLAESLEKRNVVDNAYFEIDEIRRAHLAGEGKNQEETRPLHGQASDLSSMKPKAYATQKRPLLQGTPIVPFSHQITVPYIHGVPNVSQPNKDVLYHQPYHRQQQQQAQPPPLLQQHRIPVQHHHLQNRQQLQQHFLSVAENSPWSEQTPTNNNNTTKTAAATTKTRSEATTSSELQPSATMMLHQNSSTSQLRQESFLPVTTGSRFMTNKMVSANATKCYPDVGQLNANASRQQSGHDRKPVCSAPLDNDPAVMSYSCAGVCPLTSQNRAT